MSRDEATLLDIAKAVRLVQEFTAGCDQATFLADAKTQSAVLHQLLIAGEAAKRLSDPFRDSYPQIPWREIAGMRDILIHHYDSVDLDEVWRTVSVDVPALAGFLLSLTPPPQP